MPRARTGHQHTPAGFRSAQPLDRGTVIVLREVDHHLAGLRVVGAHCVVAVPGAAFLVDDLPTAQRIRILTGSGVQFLCVVREVERHRLVGCSERKVTTPGPLTDFEAGTQQVFGDLFTRDQRGNKVLPLH